MSVEISDADWDVLDKFTPGGISEDDIAASIGAYRDEGRSDEEIQSILNNKIAEYKGIESQLAMNKAAFESDPEVKRARKALKNLNYIEPAMDILGAVGHTAGRAANTMTLGLLDAGAALVEKTAALAGLQVGLVDYIKEANQKYAIPTAVGDIAGLFTGAPKAVADITMRTATKFLKPAQTAIGGILKGAASGVATNVAIQGAMEVQKDAEKVAGTREEESEKQMLDRVAGETMWSVGLGAATGAMMGGPLGQVFKKTFNTQTKAIELCGGSKVVTNAQATAQEVLAKGGSVEQAENAFWRDIMANNTPQNQDRIRHLIKTNPEFARYMRQQMASAGAITTNTMDALSKKQLGEYSHQVYKSLYGENYVNKMGSTQFDNTQTGLEQLLGVDDGGAVYKVREAALGAAENRVAANAEAKAMMQDKFNGLMDNLRRDGEGIYQSTLRQVEQGTIKSYASSEESQEALGRAAKRIQELQQGGTKISPADITDIKNQELRRGAQEYFRKITTEGPQTVQDVNDIKNFYKQVAPRDITEGQKTALGAFDEGINSQIFDELDQGLYETNQAYRYADRMKQMHKMGATFDPDKEIVALDRALSNTTDAQFAAGKLAAFKMGWTSQLIDTAVSGDMNKFERLAAKMKHGEFAKYFSNQEIDDLIAQVRPHIEAKYYIDQNLKAASRATELTNDEVQTIRAVTSAGIGARGAFLNTLTNLLSGNYKYGPKTAKAITELAANPTWQNFNKLVKGTKDTLEKQTLMKSIAEAIRTFPQQINMKNALLLEQGLKNEGE